MSFHPYPSLFSHQQSTEGNQNPLKEAKNHRWVISLKLVALSELLARARVARGGEWNDIGLRLRTATPDKPTL